MPQNIPLELEEVKVGEASVFRSTINENFEKIKSYFETFQSGPQIVLSKEPPENLSPGDFWYKILD